MMSLCPRSDRAGRHRSDLGVRTVDAGESSVAEPERDGVVSGAEAGGLGDRGRVGQPGAQVLGSVGVAAEADRLATRLVPPAERQRTGTGASGRAHGPAAVDLEGPPA